MKLSEAELQQVQISWLKDILKRIDSVCKDKNYKLEEKVYAVEWLVKQAFKVDQDD